MRVTLVAWVAAALLLLACEDEPDELELSCDLPNTGRALSGDWTLTATGKRVGCKDRRLEGQLRVQSSMPIEVSSTAQATSGRPTGPSSTSAADAFVTRIRRADYELALGRNAPREIALTGGVVGSCVGFSLNEELEDGDSLRYEFNGFITGSHFARGDFWGQGPEGCEVEGTFELLVR